MTSVKKSVEQTRTQVIQCLADGEFHSGEALGDALGLSRAAIANHIKAICELGLEVYSVKGRGYRLNHKMSLLDKAQILTLSERLNKSLLQVNNIIDSTSDRLKEHLSMLEQGTLCVAECQTKGRGRRGRKWVSPYGAAVYMSVAYRFVGGYQSMSGLSLVVGIAIKRALAKLNIQSTQLKWPNDVYVNAKKLAGILVEVEGQLGADAHSIIGIGINVNLPDVSAQIDQSYIDLSELIDDPVDRNQLIAIVYDELMQCIDMFEQQGLSAFMQEWSQADLYFGKSVSLVSGTHTVRGISRGINELGAIILDVNGETQAHFGGEISLRPN